MRFSHGSRQSLKAAVLPLRETPSGNVANGLGKTLPPPHFLPPTGPHRVAPCRLPKAVKCRASGSITTTWIRELGHGRNPPPSCLAIIHARFRDRARIACRKRAGKFAGRITAGRLYEEPGRSRRVGLCSGLPAVSRQGPAGRLRTGAIRSGVPKWLHLSTISSGARCLSRLPGL